MLWNYRSTLVNSDLVIQYALNEFYEPFTHTPLGDYMNPKAPFKKYRTDLINITNKNVRCFVNADDVLMLFEKNKRFDIIEMLKDGGKVVLNSNMKELIIKQYPEHFV